MKRNILFYIWSWIPLIYNNIYEFTSTKNVFCWVQKSPLVEDANIIPIRKAIFLIWKNFNPLHRAICIKFGGNWPIVLQVKVANLFQPFRYYIPPSHWRWYYFSFENKRKSEQAHISHTPTLLENAAYYAYHHYEKWYWSIR